MRRRKTTTITPTVTTLDRQSVSVPGPEEYLGLIRADGTTGQPSWQVVYDYANEAI